MPDGFLTAVAAVTNTLFLLGAAYVYLSLVRQIAARGPAAPEETPRGFSWPDGILALGLATLFAANAFTGSEGGKVVLHTNDLIANGLISAAIFIFITVFLKVRARDVNFLAGFTKIPFWRALVAGGVLLLAAYPLIVLADLLSQQVLGGASSRQGIVEMFNESQTLQQRVLIIILAVAIAPMVEEFVFRFYLYGVIKRYAGRFAGLLTNSLLFAAVHAHLPSAAPLFALGLCFTIAYEWSGSILVSMTMHALFNSFTLTALAFPDSLGQ
jgi:membrane protease YdiL (CAAX protease family)